MRTVICVLKSGGKDYTAENVEVLRDNLARFSDARLVCFSDVPVPCERIPLQNDWPGWWSKLEIFKQVYNDPVLYVDLDTTFVDDPEPLWCKRFTMLARLNKPGDVGSGIMSWQGDLIRVYHAFAKDPRRFIREYVTTQQWGDQGFIRDTVGIGNISTFPLTLAASYKGHCTKNLTQPFKLPHDDVRVVYFHGKPRPWQVPPVSK